MLFDWMQVPIESETMKYAIAAAVIVLAGGFYIFYLAATPPGNR